MKSARLEHISEAQRVFELEIQSLNRASERLENSFGEVVELILSTKGRVVITGLGKSGLIAHKIAATLASTGTSSLYINAAEALHGDLGMVATDDVVIMLSNSGSTVELVQMLPSLREIGAKIIGIFGNTQSRLAEACDFVLDASVEREACPISLAPTSSSTVALVIGDALACALMVGRDFTAEQFAIYHPGGAIGRRLLLRAKDIMHSGEALAVVSPDDSLRSVAIEMTRSGLGAVCVVDANKCLLGIITDGDFRRHLVNSDDLSVSASQLMSHNPITGRPDERLNELLVRMENPKRKVYVIAITDEEIHLQGLIRMHDMF